MSPGGSMLPDFTDALPEASSENRNRKSTQGIPNASRRATILNLVELLLQSDEVKRKQSLPSPEVDRDAPSVDDHLQNTGADAFNKFSRRMGDFDRELRNFANAARQLGSSVAILSSAFHLRQRLAQILFLYRENAAALFSRKISRAPRESIADCSATGRRSGRKWTTKTPSHIVRPIVHEDIDVEDFPDQMEYFAKDIGTFLNCLNEFPEFTDEAVNTSILSFERDLQYWASCLREYSGQLRNPAVQRYLHDLSIEMGEHIDGITSTLSIFIEVGVPIIRFAQKHGATNLLNLSTVATLFSAVTATTMQFSYQLGEENLAISVNCFWFASLVFSIAAAVNSLLGLTWKQAMYRSPSDRVPWWVLIWIKRSPLVFLVMSVACFSVGFCFFTYASGQAEVTSTITTVLTALTSFGLCAVSAWFATERWIFMRYQGKKWLDDVLTEITETMLQNRVVDISRHGIEKIGSGLLLANSVTFQILDATQARFRAFFLSSSCISNRQDDPESALPTTNDYVPQASSDRSKESPAGALSSTGRKFRDKAPGSLSLHTNLGSSINGPRSPSIASQDKKSPIYDVFSHTNATLFPTGGGTVSAGKQRWMNAVRAVRLQAVGGEQSPTPTVGTPGEPSRRRTGSSSNLTDALKKKASVTTKGAIAKSRSSSLIPKLKELEAVEDLAAHTALVKHMEFSPDGKYLATSSWDRTSVIFKVKDPFVLHRILGHHTKGFVSQVAWSPDGRYLLTKMSKGMKVWTPDDGICKGTIEREEYVGSVTWCHSDHKFLSIEGSKICQLDIAGKEFNVLNLGAIKILDVAVTPDDKRVLAIGPLLQSPSGLLPSKSRQEKRLIVLNIENKQIECQVPVLNDIRDVTLVETHKHELVALISYENMAPPQLWKLEILKDRENGRESSRLALRHTYMPKCPVHFTGPSYFGGQDHELILCAGKKGDILIWDRESGILLHQIRGRAHSGDLTCIAWNHAAIDPFMFASGSHDGAVHIWTKPPDSPEYQPEESDGPDHRETHLGERDYFSYGNMMRSSSPTYEDMRYLDSELETPDLEHIENAAKVRLRPLLIRSWNSSDPSIIREPLRSSTDRGMTSDGF